MLSKHKDQGPNGSPFFEIFPWNSNFLLGVQFIDEQHQHLVQLLNKVIWQFVTYDDNNANDQALNELTDFVRYHFAEEEKLWQEYFGDQIIFTNHAGSHNDFFSQIKRIQQKNAAGEACAEKLIAYLTKWLAIHILHSDRFLALIVQEIETNGTTYAKAEKLAKIRINQAPILQSSIIELYTKLSSTATQLIREKNARIIAQQKLEKALKYQAVLALESQALEYQNHLKFLAYNDPLTGLLNRNGLLRELRKKMAATLSESEPIAVISINLDFFALIATQLGDENTNHLLGILARRWQDALMPNSTIAYLGSDDFAVIMKNGKLLSTQMEALYLAASQTFHIGEWQNCISFTAGVSLYPQKFDQDSLDADKLLRQADYALYQAKQESRSTMRIFDTEEDRQRRLKNDQIAEIREALRKNQLILYYQPKVDMQTGRLFGIEALIRWQHPKLFLLSPAAFLPALEKHPIMIELGEWVIDTAIRQMISWDKQGLHLNISVNIDALQIQSQQFPSRLRQILANYPEFDPKRLDIEILETVAINDIDIAISNIQQCRDFGVTFSLDDFGKGYCSLSYLKQLPVDTLKIDQAFVRDMLDDANNVSILEGILSIAKTFNLKVVAEGVESIMHGEILIQIGCALAQGYSIARPMPANKVNSWLNSWQPCEQWQQSRALRRDDILALTGLTELNSWIKHIKDTSEAKASPSFDLEFHSKNLEKWLETNLDDRYMADIEAVQQIERIYLQLLALGNKLQTGSSKNGTSEDNEADQKTERLEANKALIFLTEKIASNINQCLKQNSNRK